MSPLIKVIELSKYYGEQKVVDDVNFEISESSMCVIQGPSGSGKSTFLYLLAGLEKSDAGHIYFEDHDMAKMSLNELAIFRNKHIGLIFQFHFLLPSMNVMDNILLPTRIAGDSTQKCLDEIMPVVHELGVSSLLKKYPYQLSGGEQQRVNIIRAIGRNPKIILCDEPTGNLDSQNSEKVVKLLMSISKTKKTTLVLVTHDKLTASYFSQSYIMQDGKLILKGS